MKKIIYFFVLLTFLIFTGCDFFEPKVTLKLFHYKNDIAAQLGQMNDAFHEKYPKITIEVEYIPYVDPYFLDQRFKSNTAPDVIMVQPYQVLYYFAEKGYLSSISKGKYLDRILDSTKKSVSFNNEIYGIPFNINGIGVIYNKDIFGKYNLEIPETFSKLKEDCSILKKNNITPFAVSIKDSWTLGHLFSMAYSASLKNNDDVILNQCFLMNSGKGVLDNPDFENIFKFLDFYKINSGKNALKMTWNDQIANYSTEKYAMMVQGLYSYNVSKTINSKINSGFFPFPFTDNKSETKLYADTETVFAISAQSSKNKIKAANKYLDFITGEEGKKIIVEKLKLVPALKDADVSSLNEPYRDLYKYEKNGKTTVWSYQIINSEVFEYSKQLMQDYYYGKLDSKKLVKMLDDKWKKVNKK